MPGFNLKSFLANLDTASQTLTGRKLAPNLLRVYEVYRQSSEPINDDDYNDCELLGVSPNATERVMKVALNAYKIDNHPDKLLEKKGKDAATERCKNAALAFDRIKERRGWTK